MSRPLRRTLSWVFVLAIVAATLIGWNHVPGAGGVINELRWLLARDNVPPQYYNRAKGLILLAEADKPGSRVTLFRVLLIDEDPRVARGAAQVIVDSIMATGGQPNELSNLFCEWVRSAPGNAKIADKLLGPARLGTEDPPDPVGWRELCESGGAASQPGAGDGGG